MRIHINQIPPEGKHLEGEEESDILELEAEATISPLGPVHYALDIGLSKGGIFATGRLWVETEMECVRCLKKFPYRAEVADFAFQEQLNGRETVDLTPPMREDILLALPAYPHCDSEGGRECPVKIEKEDPGQGEEAGPASAWEALEGFKTKDQEK